MNILDEQVEGLLKEERQLLSDLRVALARFGAPAEDQETLGESIQQLDDFFLLVVVGEFNSGKSAFINALLGEPVLEEGEIPTTAQVTILRHGEELGRVATSDRLHTVTAPIELLSDVSIVDTPGTNSIIRGHEEITTDFVPRSDLVLFVTSVDRPFTESERLFLERIRDWGKKVVVIVNKVDILETEGALENVAKFVASGARDSLGVEPQVFMVSTKLAQRAKHGEPALWDRSRFEPLERYIQETLDEGERLRLKLANPLGVGNHLVKQYLGVVDERIDLLGEDLTLLTDVDQQLVTYRQDMARDFDLHMKGIENVLYEMEQRGRDFFEETFRLRRVFDLLDKKAVQQGFERQVVGDVPRGIERKVNELIDWVVDSDYRQWQAVTDYLAERRRQHRERIIGDAAGGFHYERERLFEGLGREAQRLVDEYDREREAQEIADGARFAVATVAAMEVGAVGLGTLVVALATTVAADVTGLLMASLVAFLGLFVIPGRRRQAEREMREKIAAMRDRLTTTLRNQFEREMERIMERIHRTIAPYSRFVRTEHSRLTSTRNELDELRAAMEQLRARVEAIG
jgi:GTP-binding protein EngB required for normal cell division